MENTVQAGTELFHANHSAKMLYSRNCGIRHSDAIKTESKSENRGAPLL